VPKRSDIQAQIDKLTADLDAADTDDEVWIRDGSREIKVTGNRATTILGKFSDLWKSEPDEDDDDQDDDDNGKPDKKPAGGGYFGKRAK
jgi:hypothetical protein